MPDLIVVGGGPAGLMGAITAAERGKSVLLLEYLPAPGRKLLASGAGKCNFTNILEPEEMARRFIVNDRFLLPALRHFSSAALREWFFRRGVSAVTDDDFHFFPSSKKASDLLNLLLNECRRLHVDIQLRSEVQEIISANGTVEGVIVNGKKISAPAVLLACGGRSYPKLGATGKGYLPAEKAGHKLVPTVPALVGLKLKEAWGSSMPGIILPTAQMTYGKRSGRTGELIFTHSGISGPAVLDLSGEVNKALLNTPEVQLHLALNAEYSKQDWQELFQKWRKENGKKQLSTLLAAEFPAQFVQLLLELSHIPADRKAALLPAQEQNTLLNNLTALPVTANGNDGWLKAMATAGGVSPEEVKANSLESKLVKGLYFAGEMLDVGAPCGGYNIQWAFSSARLAASKC